MEFGTLCGLTQSAMDIPTSTRYRILILTATLVCAFLLATGLLLARLATPQLDARDLYLGPSSVGNAVLAARYRILAITPQSSLERAVDSESAFRTGDCIALELVSNFDGYLFVLSNAASGSWTSLVPSSADPSEVHKVSPHAPTRIPQRDCIEFTDPPGKETLVLYFSTTHDAAQRIFDRFRLANSTNPPREQSSDTKGLLRQLESRDLRRRKTGPTSSNPADPPFSVYVATIGKGLFLEIPLVHK